jgi:hypothetical protein
MAESTLTIDYDTVRRSIGRDQGYPRDPDNWSTRQSLDMPDFIKGGERRFYYPPGIGDIPPGYRWSFLSPTATLSIVSGTSSYNLPDNFGGLDGSFKFAAGDKQLRTEKITEDEILSLQAKSPASGPPKYHAISAEVIPEGRSQNYKVAFYPTPAAAYTFTYNYNVIPETLSDTNKYHLGGAPHSETFLLACLSVVEEMLTNEEGVHTKAFYERLQSSIALDMEMAAPGVASSWEVTEPLYGTYGWLQRQVGQYAGYGTNPEIWSHAQDRQVSSFIQDGLMRFITSAPLPGDRVAWEWSFLRPVATLGTVADQDTYLLPDDFAMIQGLITFAPGDSVIYPPISIVSEEDIRNRRQRHTSYSGQPVVAAVTPKRNEGVGIQRYNLDLWPTPDGEYTLSYRYRINPPSLSDSTKYPPGGVSHAQTILAACLAAVDIVFSKNGGHEARYVERLAASVHLDRRVNAPEYLGRNGDGSSRRRSVHDLESYVHWANLTPTPYNGTTY